MAAKTEEQEAEEIFAKFDAGLTKYFLSFNKQYEVGKFFKWCEDIGFCEEVSQLEEEFTGSPADSSYVMEQEDDDGDDRLDNFISCPFPDNIADNNKRMEMFKILKKIWKNLSNITITKDIDFSQMTLQAIDDKKHKKLSDQVLEEYGDQVPEFTGAQEKDVLYYLVQSRLNNDFPLLISYCDAFLRDVISERIKNENNLLNKNDWIKGLKNFQVLKQSKLDVVLANAIQGYIYRTRPPFQLNGSFYVKDKIEDVIKYVILISKFINSLLHQKNAKVPFQIDLLITLKDTVSVENILEPDLSDEDDDDDDDDDEEDHDDQKKDDQNTLSLDAIEEKLEHENCGFHAFNVDKKKEVLPRFLDKNYDEFKKKLGAIKKNTEWNNIKDRNPFKFHIPFNAKTYPTKKRFGVFVDRQGDEDKMIFFEPPAVCDSMPSNKTVPEWHIESSKKCEIPSKGYGNGVNPANSSDVLNSLSMCGGKLMTFSFHVIAEDIIRCYMYWNGQVMRFYPQDMIHGFQFVFSPESHKEFKESKKCNALMKEMFIKDWEFESFYNYIKNGRKEKKKGDFPIEQF